MVTDLSRRLNAIYQKNIFTHEYSNIYFRVKEVRILFDFCTECNATQKVSDTY